MRVYQVQQENNFIKEKSRSLLGQRDFFLLIFKWWKSKKRTYEH